ncbi:MAG: hypothetical protein HRU33_22245 [Rhodobacteraceae bacterium]|nr:hypothetical protein [Paracoccaceae bacterium]
MNILVAIVGLKAVQVAQAFGGDAVSGSGGHSVLIEQAAPEQAEPTVSQIAAQSADHFPWNGFASNRVEREKPFCLSVAIKGEGAQFLHALQDVLVQEGLGRRIGVLTLEPGQLGLQTVPIVQ